jgi:hypothetical protein
MFSKRSVPRAETCPLARDGAPHQQNRNCLIVVKMWSWAPDGCVAPRQTGRPTVDSNITWLWKPVSSARKSIENWQLKLEVGVGSQSSPGGSSWRKYRLKSAVRLWGWNKMVATLRGLESGSWGTSAVGSRYQATWMKTLVFLWQWSVKCICKL